MKYINKEFKRMSFHDSYIIVVERIDETTLFYFDFAWLENYSEKNISNDFYVDNCLLRIESVKNENIQLNFEGTPGHNKRPNQNLTFDSIDTKRLSVIMNQDIDETNNTIILRAYYKYESMLCMLIWKMEYTKMTLEWK